ncbi:hypothetical protein AQUCO_00700585v1 [Aquilegia coerulea]|uniref:Myb/SANT-like domain-containing protein n=1 Tax=Aquilegia coerulea TaxID=218851 RepID=A0A2G5ELB2_AQUCA|nr:hypothetical protein AQUCO_00700585v1 [Aquilegia coerulea]
MDSILIRVLYDEALSGNRRSDNGWKPEAIKHVVDAVVAHCGYALMAKNVRGRLKTMKKEYGAAKEALDLSGFTFNNETNLIEADETAWSDYLRDYPKASYLRNKMLPHYEETVIIFGKDVATGGLHFEPGDDIELDDNMEDVNQSPCQGDANLIDEIDSTLEEDEPMLNPIGGDTFSGVDGAGRRVQAEDSGTSAASGARNGRNRRATSAGPHSRRTKSRFASNSEDAEIRESFKLLAEAAKDIASSFRSPDYMKLDAAMRVIPDLSEEDIYAAMEMFSNSKEAAGVFFGLSEVARVGWLHRKLSFTRYD